MTLEALLDCSADKLQALTEEELTSYLSHYFIVTRPELAKESRQQNSKQNPLKMLENAEHQKKLQSAKELAKALGVDLGI